MTTRVTPAATPELADLHAALRFAVAVTGAFVAGEVFGWWPSFLAAALAVALVTNLPTRPTAKTMLVLVLVMTFAAGYAFVLSALLRGMPIVLFGAIALTIFLALHALASGKPVLPLLLLLISLATVPVVMMVAPDYGDVLPTALVRGIAVALAAIWLVHAAWPQVAPPAAKPPAPAQSASPLLLASLASAVVLPLMLAYLLLGIVDALPVLVTTVMLVMNFDPQRGGKHALAMVVGNFAGGLLGMLMHSLLLTTPTLPFLALLLFVVLMGFARAIAAGGAKAAVATIACNAMLIIFGSAISAGTGSLSIWLVRVFQFALAGAFAIAAMAVLWHLFVRSAPGADVPSPSAAEAPQ